MKRTTLVFLMAITAFTFVLEPQTVEASCQERIHAQHNGTVYYRDNRNLGWMHNDRNVAFLNQSRPPSHSDYYPPNQPSSVINQWGTSGWVRSGGDTWASGIQDSFSYTPRTQLVYSSNGPHGAGYYFRADSGNLNRYRRPVMVYYHRDVTHPDTSPPTINASPTSSDWTRSVTVTLSFSDVGCSGYRDHRVQWTTSTSRPTSGWSAWAGHSSRNYTSPSGASGVRYLHVEARDNNNNVAYRRLGPFHLDNQPPNVSASPGSTDWTTSAIQVSLSFSDAHSGFRRYRHAWTTSTATPSSWSSWSTNASPTLTAPTQQGTWYLHVQVEDQVGNTDTRSFGPYRKNNAPVANFSWSPATIYNNTTVTFNNTSSDPDGDGLTYRWEFQAP
ncbi:hypothetical protein, partial [Caldalkalibacillus thermarum]|uniref:hypothetical protein n=1 Tax=Caldalkalibacillus thermarum TaxID=296745 RepID=UPI00166684C7